MATAFQQVRHCPNIRARWVVALAVSGAMAISYCDRQAFPWAVRLIAADIPFGNETKATLDTAFLATYGLMYLGGGWLLDRLGTRRGFLVIMTFWSLACASQGLALGLVTLGISRLLLGAGEGGGFPAATRVVAEWFDQHDRSTAMGLVNAGTAIGAVLAPALIGAIVSNGNAWGLAAWRWVFFATGAMGLAWALCWLVGYHAPALATACDDNAVGPVVTLGDLVRHRAVRGIILAKFLSDGAWYFYLFWLPKYLFEMHGLDLGHAVALGWIPYAAAGLGSVGGGWLSARLLRRGRSLGFARKFALGLSAACMPWVMFAPACHAVWPVIALFSLAFFGQQSWSTLLMTLPADLVPVSGLGRLAGLVGLGGAFGGIVVGQIAGRALDTGLGYTPVLAVAALLHPLAFVLVCREIPDLRKLDFNTRALS